VPSSGLAAAAAFLKPRQNLKTLPYKIPATSPPVARGKRVVVVLAGAGSLGGKEIAQGFQQAAKQLGWSSTVVDGQFNTTVQTTAIASAISEKANAIVLDAMNPAAVAGAVAQAAAQKIPVVSELNPVPTIAKLVPGVLADVSSGGIDGGMAEAAWVTVHSGGKASIIFYTDPTLALTDARTQGFLTGIREFCPRCKILTRFTLDEATMSTALPVQMAADIRRFGNNFSSKNPLYVVAPHDVGGLSMEQGIVDAHATSKVVMVSIDALPQVLTQIRKGGIIKADWVQAFPWLGWDTADQLNRIFNHEPQSSYQGSDYVVQEMMLDAQHINPSGAWTPQFNYQAAYRSLWKVGS